MAPDRMGDAAAWLEDQHAAGRLSEKIDEADLLVIAGVLVQNDIEREGTTPRARHRPKEVGRASGATS